LPIRKRGKGGENLLSTMEGGKKEEKRGSSFSRATKKKKKNEGCCRGRKKGRLSAAQEAQKERKAQLTARQGRARRCAADQKKRIAPKKGQKEGGESGKKFPLRGGTAGEKRGSTIKGGGNRGKQTRPSLKEKKTRAQHRKRKERTLQSKH